MYAKSLLGWATYDEAMSVTLGSLAVAIRRFDATKGHEFSTYAFTCMSNATKVFANKMKREAKVPQSESFSVIDEDTVPNTGRETIDDGLIAEALSKMLTEKEASALSMVSEGHTYEEVQRSLGFSPWNLRRIRGKAKIALYATGSV